MLEHFTPSRLRANSYRILDRILETGNPGEITVTFMNIAREHSGIEAPTAMLRIPPETTTDSTDCGRGILVAHEFSATATAPRTRGRRCGNSPWKWAMTRFRAWPTGARNGLEYPKVHGRRIYADCIQADPQRRHVAKGRSRFAFSDGRGRIANIALSSDFPGLWPSLRKPRQYSFVSLLLRIVA